MNFQDHLAAIGAGSADHDAIADFARFALAEEEEEGALPWVMRAASQGSDARLWQWAGLLQRALDEHEAALASFAEAARRAPSDASIAHGHARVALEAGIDAVALFERASRLGPPKGDVLVGLAAARMAAGQGEMAAAALDEILIQVPLWLDGHRQLAQLRAMLGQPDMARSSIDRALAALPQEPALWHGLFALDLQSEDYAALAEDISRAHGVDQTDALRAEYEAIAAAELGQTAQADALFEAAQGSVYETSLPLWHIRHLLRSGRLDPALKLIDRTLKTDHAPAVWPYAAVAWRLAGDSRSAWLERDQALVTVADLGPELPPADRLAQCLRGLNVAKGRYLDQSVRGGTQTDGPLFSRIEPEIRAVRAAVKRAAERYIAQLPPPDPGHPLLGKRRDRRIRFAGSWSVCLRGGGHHANHVHPEGWISSALYVALPERQSHESPQSGWLTLGEPQAALGLHCPPDRVIEPRPGQLVLFPSWMWHGTHPFADGERMTIAFDVAPPR